MKSNEVTLAERAAARIDIFFAKRNQKEQEERKKAIERFKLDLRATKAMFGKMVMKSASEGISTVPVIDVSNFLEFIEIDSDLIVVKGSSLPELQSLIDLIRESGYIPIIEESIFGKYNDWLKAENSCLTAGPSYAHNSFNRK